MSRSLYSHLNFCSIPNYFKSQIKTLVCNNTFEVSSYSINVILIYNIKSIYRFVTKHLLIASIYLSIYCIKVSKTYRLTEKGLLRYCFLTHLT